MRLDRLIAAKHGRAAAAAFKAYRPTAEDRDALREVATGLLSEFNPLAGACMMMSSLLAQRLAPRLSGPAYVVSGGLQVRGVRVYDAVPADLPPRTWSGTVMHGW